MSELPLAPVKPSWACFVQPRSRLVPAIPGGTGAGGAGGAGNARVVVHARVELILRNLHAAQHRVLEHEAGFGRLDDFTGDAIAVLEPHFVGLCRDGSEHEARCEKRAQESQGHGPSLLGLWPEMSGRERPVRSARVRQTRSLGNAARWNRRLVLTHTYGYDARAGAFFARGPACEACIRVGV